MLRYFQWDSCGSGTQKSRGSSTTYLKKMFWHREHFPICFKILNRDQCYKRMQTHFQRNTTGFLMLMLLTLAFAIQNIMF